MVSNKKMNEIEDFYNSKNNTFQSAARNCGSFLFHYEMEFFVYYDINTILLYNIKKV